MKCQLHFFDSTTFGGHSGTPLVKLGSGVHCLFFGDFSVSGKLEVIDHDFLMLSINIVFKISKNVAEFGIPRLMFVPKVSKYTFYHYSTFIVPKPTDVRELTLRVLMGWPFDRQMPRQRSSNHFEDWSSWDILVRTEHDRLVLCSILPK